MARTFSAFVCLSDEVTEELGKHGVGADRLRRIPNGVDSDRFRPASPGEREAERERLGLDPEGVLALYTGRFAPVKRLDLLIDAVARVPNLRLAMVGEGSEEQELRGTIEARNLGGRVKLLPLVDDPAPLYRAADLYVCASSTEGMSNSVLEAMASGLPIVAAKASGMAELVTPQTGVLVDGASSSTAFAAGLTEVADDPALRRRLGSEARSLVGTNYSLESVAIALRGLYDEVLSYK
jgi:glycosyltransferase involved in cell wall biosynthesis